MLQIAEISRFASTSPQPTGVTPDRPVRTMTGRRLNRVLKHASIRDRTLLGFELARGTMQLRHFTHAQAAKLVGLSHLHRRQVLTIDERIDRVIAKFGAERVMAALDRYTQPSLLPAG